MPASATERPAAAVWRRQSRRLPALIATLTAVYGLLSLLSALLPRERFRIAEMSRLITAPGTATATAATAAAGILLLQLARGLRRRKQRAWRAAVAVTVVLMASHVLKGLDVEEATMALILLVLLIVSRKEFYARGDPGTRWLAVRAFLTLAGSGVLSGLLLLFLYRHRIADHPSFAAQLEHVVLGLAGISGPVQIIHERPREMVTATLGGFGVLTAFVTAYLVFRSPQPEPVLTADDERRLRDLLAKHGHRDSLGYFALRRDKSVVWSASGKAAITYRVVAGVMLASADPIGDPEAWPGAIEEFLELARVHAWVPAVIGCSEQAGVAWKRYGLDALELGDEAAVDVARFSLEGRAMRNVRQMVNRVSRAGYRASVRRLADIPAGEVAALAAAAHAWRGATTERGFSMALSRFGDPADGDCVVVTAHTEGTLRALLNFVPWGSDGLSLDLMRRDRTADGGLNEFLITELIAAAPDLGVKRISLNFAAFRAALERGERLGAGPVSRLWTKVLLFASRWFQIESLYRFNAKFQPDWYPRYVCFPATRDLPRIAVAALEAEAFVGRPRPFRRLAHGRLARRR